MRDYGPDMRDKYPLRVARDAGHGVTIRDLLDKLADPLATGDIEAACVVLDELFVYGAWGHLLSGSDTESNRWPPDYLMVDLRRDIRGLVEAAFASVLNWNKIKLVMDAEESEKDRLRKAMEKE